MRNDDRYAQDWTFGEDQASKESAIEETLFRDEAIPGVGDEVVRLPAALVQLRQLGEALNANGLGEAQIFRREAELVARFEYEGDENAWTDSYFPSYDTLSDKALLAYFSWRTRLRRYGATSIAQQTSQSMGMPPTGFLFLYIYELLNGVGVASSLEAWEKIKAFRDDLGSMGLALARAVPRWLDDLVIRDGLALERLSGDRKMGLPDVENLLPFDELCESLKSAPKNAEREAQLFEHFVKHSTYRPLKSTFSKTHREAIQSVATRAFLRALKAPDAQCQNLYTAIRGQWWSERKELFRGALVDPAVGPSAAERRISAREKWVCRKGIWYQERYSNSRALMPTLTNFLLEVENALRDKYGARKLKGSDLLEGSVLRQAIAEEVAYMTRSERVAANPARKLDFGQLARIRTDAAAVRESLIVSGSENDGDETESEWKGATVSLVAGEVEKNEKDLGLDVTVTSLANRDGKPKEASDKLVGAAGVGTHEVAQETIDSEESLASVARAPKNSSVLGDTSKVHQTPPNETTATFTAAERVVLEEVLRTGHAQPPAGMSAEGFADRINDLLMERVGDTVLEVVAGQVHLVEDYVEELALALGE